MTEKLHDTLGELYRGESYERSKPKRGEALDLEGSDLENIGDADADSVITDQANIGDGISSALTGITWDRNEVNKSDTTVQVPQDEPTIQDALRKVPRRLIGSYQISLDESQDPYDENLVIPPVYSEEVDSTTEGGNAGLLIDTQGGGRVTIRSLIAIAGKGQKSLIVTNVDADTTNPYDDEASPWAFYGWNHAALSNCGVVGGGLEAGSNGILSYQSSLKLETAFDWGTDLVSIGGKTKQRGEIHVDAGFSASGSVTDHAWESVSGPIEHTGIGPTATNNFMTDPRRNGQSVAPNIAAVSFDGTVTDAIRVRADDGIEIRDGTETRRVHFTAAGPDVFYDETGTELARFSDGQLQVSGAGGGVEVTSPDGNTTLEIGIDNSGNVVSR